MGKRRINALADDTRSNPEQTMVAAMIEHSQRYFEIHRASCGATLRDNGKKRRPNPPSKNHLVRQLLFGIDLTINFVMTNALKNVSQGALAPTTVANGIPCTCTRSTQA
mmetsp:Transcript_2438/g.5043  ORF Transcript_2438/g.5043 Transcript_2438/m.5043 type:complete len:109 (-) Transcript_2438:435-761(-)